jgi:hypothetical protein
LNDSGHSGHRVFIRGERAKLSGDAVDFVARSETFLQDSIGDVVLVIALMSLTSPSVPIGCTTETPTSSKPQSLSRSGNRGPISGSPPLWRTIV